MWDNPAALNRISDLLWAAATLMVLYAALHWAMHQPVFAMQELHVGGGAKHVTIDQVEAIVKRDMHGTFFTLDLPAVRASFEKLPWVRTVTLRRQWPDRLEVAVEEHRNEDEDVHDGKFEEVKNDVAPVVARRLAIS